MDQFQSHLDGLKRGIKDDSGYSLQSFQQITDRMQEASRDLGLVQESMARRAERYAQIFDILQKMMSETRAG